MPESSLEPLITECPSCHTRFRVTELQLGKARGRVRCGACLSVFLATESLIFGTAMSQSDAPTGTELDELLDELGTGKAKRTPEPGPRGRPPAVSGREPRQAALDRPIDPASSPRTQAPTAFDSAGGASTAPGAGRVGADAGLDRSVRGRGVPPAGRASDARTGRGEAAGDPHRARRVVEEAIEDTLDRAGLRAGTLEPDALEARRDTRDAHPHRRDTHHPRGGRSLRHRDLEVHRVVDLDTHRRDTSETDADHEPDTTALEGGDARDRGMGSDVDVQPGGDVHARGAPVEAIMGGSAAPATTSASGGAAAESGTAVPPRHATARVAESAPGATEEPAPPRREVHGADLDTRRAVDLDTQRPAESSRPATGPASAPEAETESIELAPPPAPYGAPPAAVPPRADAPGPQRDRTRRRDVAGSAGRDTEMVVDVGTPLSLELDRLAMQEVPARSRWWLPLALFLAIVALGGQVLYFQFDQWTRDPRWRPLYEAICAPLGCRLPVLRALEAIQSRNLVVRSHPEVPDALLVDAIVVNEASFPQPFPLIELRFSSLTGSLVAGRRFTPAEYLSGELRGAEVMQPRTPVHIALEIEDPGAEAVNYVMVFR